MPGPLTHSPADVLRQLLINLGLGTDGGASWPVHVAAEPDAPDSVITVYDTNGRLQGKRQVDGVALEYYGIQFRVRGARHVLGYQKSNAVISSLDTDVYDETVTVTALAGVPVATYLVHAVHRTTGIIALGKATPTAKLSLFVVNAITSIRKVS